MRVYIGFDDTDVLNSDFGTGKLARRFEKLIPGECRVWGVVRQQLLADPAILIPDSVEGRELRNEGPAMQINYADAYKAWTLLVDPNLRQIVSAKMQTVIILHEMGHGIVKHFPHCRG